MYYVYLIQSEINMKKLYLGSTKDLKKRIIQHNKKRVKSTFKYIPWKLIYYEAFLSEKDAREREHKLKHHGKGMYDLKKRLINSTKFNK